MDSKCSQYDRFHSCFGHACRRHGGNLSPACGVANVSARIEDETNIPFSPF